MSAPEPLTAPVPARTPAALAERFQDCACVEDRTRLAAQCITQAFDRYYTRTRRMPAVAQAAFEAGDAQRSIRVSRERLNAYTEEVQALGVALSAAFPALAEDESLWQALETEFLPLIRGRYETDLAFAWFHSLRRWYHRGEWYPVDYSFRDHDRVLNSHTFIVHQEFETSRPVSAATVARVLGIPGFTRGYRDIDADARAVASRLNERLAQSSAEIRALHVLKAGFFRNRGGYIVGRIARAKHTPLPLVIALLNSPDGIYVDAVLTGEADAHNIFSSTLANFHVSNTRYHELAAFLHSIMPKRPLGLHYSTIGYNHVGKVAVMNELRKEIANSGERFALAVGNPGTVAIGFSTPSSAYNLKIIRNHPTAGYKWGTFDGVPSVLRKYSQVHEINRTGSMLDNIIYYGIELDAAWFDPALLEDLIEHASDCVHVRGDKLLFRHLIVQRRMTPLPVFLETADEDDIRTVVANLGDCIKNNAAANIFNKDLDARNYGVSRLLKVYLFDYDALEVFTEVKVRSNADHVDGDEEVPDWFFEDGVIFLPEELEANLRFERRDLRHLFRSLHGDLFERSYWESLQRELLSGAVPSIRVYPESERLRPRTS